MPPTVAANVTVATRSPPRVTTASFVDSPAACPREVIGDHRRKRQARTGPLERNVAVLPGRPALALRLRRFQRLDQHRARAPRLDHVVDVAALGGDERI